MGGFSIFTNSVENDGGHRTFVTFVLKMHSALTFALMLSEVFWPASEDPYLFLLITIK